MSTKHRSRTAMAAAGAVLAFALSAPIAVHAEDQVSAMEEPVLVTEEQGPALAPITAPAEDATSTEEVRAAKRVLAAQRALLTGDIGSLQEERLLAIVAAGPSWDEASAYGAVGASRAANAQQALLSPDLGSLQEEALTAIVEASSAEVER